MSIKKLHTQVLIAMIGGCLLGLMFNLITQGCSNLVELVGGAFIGMVVGFIYFIMIM